MPDDPTTFYGADLARIHHEGFGGVAEAAAAELLRRLHARGIRGGTVVDLAAGSGILSRRLGEAGYGVVGIDLSTEMLRLARAHATGAQFVQGSLWNQPLPRCVAVAAIGEAFNYATAATTPTLASLARRLHEIGRALVGGGVLLFDVAAPGRSGPLGGRDVFRQTDTAFVHLEEIENRATGRLTRQIHAFTPVGDLYRLTVERHELVLYDVEAVEAAVRNTGLTVERSAGYVGGPNLPGWHVFAATKA